MEGPSPHTLAYLAQAALLLSPFPSFSSSTSISLSSHLPNGLTSTARSTKCSKCLAEVVGGVNGSYWRENGQSWCFCEGCGWSSARSSQMLEGGKGKEKFQRVKRRKLSGITEMRKVESVVVGRESTPSLIKDLPITSTPSSRKVSKPLVPITATPPILIPSTSHKESSLANPPVAQSPAPIFKTPAPSSVEPPPPISTKRKRSKQQTGLAALLEAKKKEKSAERSLGLSDFLSAM